MKHVLLLISLLILIAGCAQKEILIEENLVEEKIQQTEDSIADLTDDEILAKYDDDLDDALAELEQVE